jgi:hypothetical protein
MPTRIRLLPVIVFTFVVFGCGGSGGTTGGGGGGPKTIPGFTAGDIKVNLENRGFTCTGPGGGATVNYFCSAGDYSVSMSGPGVTNIDLVSAVALVDDSAAADFLGYIASLPYDDANPSAARDWVTSNMGSTGTATFGSARFTLGGPAGGRTLDIAGI